MNDERARAFGRHVRTLRRALGLTQEQLAERADISVRTLISLESAQTGRMRPTTLRALGAALELQGPELEHFAHGASERSQIPSDLSPLIGREAEVADILALLSGHVRAIAVVGPPGVGKSRVAAAVARSAADRYVDGARFISLADVSEEDRAVVAVTDTLDLRLSGAAPAAESLARALSRKSALLVLDNVDGFRATAKLVRSLTDRAEGIAVIVTSRHHGAVPFAQEYALAPLMPPGPADVADVERVAASPAVQLFVARARLVDPTFRLDASNAAAVAACATSLDGLPLAIELAAPYLRLHGPAELADRLARSMALVIDRSDPSGDSPRTLRQTLGLSYDALDAAARSLLAAAAVFRAGATIEGLARVSERPESDVEFSLLALLEANLVSLDERRRVRVLYVVREFVQAHVGADIEAMRRLHAEYFLDTIATVAERAAPSERARLYEREMENLDAAFENALALDDRALALRLAIATAPFARASRIRHGLAQIERALDAVASFEAPREQVALARYLAASFRYETTEYGRAMDHAQQAKALYDELGDETLGNVLDHFMAALLVSQGFVALAKSRLEASIAKFKHFGDERRYARALLNLASSHELERRFDEALGAAATALEIFVRGDDHVGRASAYLVLGRIAATRDDLESAREWLEKSLALRRSLDDRMAIAQVVVVLALVEHLAGDDEAASGHIVEATGLNRTVQDGHVEAKLALAAASYALRRGATPRAEALAAYYAAHHEHTCIEPIWQREREALRGVFGSAVDGPRIESIETLVEAATVA